MKRKKIYISILILLIISITFPSFAEDSMYVWANNENKLDSNQTNDTAVNQNLNQTQDTVNLNNTISTQNVTNSDENNIQMQDTSNPLNFESESCVLIEQSTGQVLYSHNPHEQLRPASVTKVMSILLIMEQIHNGKLSFDDQIPCSETASAMGGSQIWLNTTESLSVDEMLKAICVVSANDCVVAMAEYIAGSQEAFVQMMNDKAKELGMNDTCFKNCHGIDEDGHVTSSYDIALMSRELLTKYPEITKYTTIYMDSLRGGKSELVNTNKLIKTYDGATGLKTGSTSLALYNLSASATRNDMSLIGVIMKAPSSKVRFAEASKLLDYGFSNYSFKEFAKKRDVLKTIDVNKGVEKSLDVVFEKDAGVILKKGEDKNINQEIELNENIMAPISEGEKLGTVKYVLDGETLATADLVANSTIEKTNFFTMFKKVYYSWVNLLR